jgi:hypothetical protein
MLHVPPISYSLDLIRSRGSVFCIATVQSGVRVPVQEINFYFLEICPHRPLGPPSMLFDECLSSFLGKVAGT